MIAKGNQHNNGVKLAAYLLKGKEHERAELWEFRGFGSNTNLKDGFRDVHILAGASKAQQPFFHVQVRLPEGETLSREQWQRTADRIERIHGLTGQARAIVFHIDERTGDEHMHVAWSRIDADTLKARPLPFFKERLKRISRELEKEFDITRVRNERESPIKFAATKPEQEQARRLGIDAELVRTMIRNSWDQSDCGRSFEAALADQGLILTQGDRRSFVVVDQAGGLHALGKRILDANKAQIHERLADLDRGHLPTVEQTREFLRELPRKSEQQPQPWDRDGANRAWEDAVAKAGIEHEKIERRFVEPRQSTATAAGGSRKRDWQEVHASREMPKPEITQQAIRDKANERSNATRVFAGMKPAKRPETPGVDTRRYPKPIVRAAPIITKAPARVVGSIVGAIGNAAESLLSGPKLTPQQKHQNEVERRERAAQAEDGFDVMKYLAERAEARRLEQQREAEFEQKRGRDRER